MSLVLDVVTRCRPMPGEVECGDRAVSWEDGAVLLIAVIDGLGHGPKAALAAAAAVETIEEHRALELGALFAACDAALRATRGAVMTIVRIDRATGRAWHAAIGNVEARIVGSGDVPMIPTPGVLGARARAVRVRPFEWCAGSTLVVHTDGISSRISLDRMQGRAAEAIADELLTVHAKEHDDAGCAIVVG